MRHWVCQAIFQNSNFFNVHLKFQNNLQFLRFCYIAYFNDFNWINKKKVKKLYVAHAHYAPFWLFSFFHNLQSAFTTLFIIVGKCSLVFYSLFFLLRKIIFQKCLKSVRILRNVSGEGKKSTRILLRGESRKSISSVT